VFGGKVQNRHVRAEFMEEALGKYSYVGLKHRQVWSIPVNIFRVQS
jgi:hypothetical protein